VKRRLFNAGAVVSLVLCLATAAVWVRSYGYSDFGLKQVPWGQASFRSSDGSVSFEWSGQRTNWSPYVHQTGRISGSNTGTGNRTRVENFYKFNFETRPQRRGGGRYVTLTLPYWLSCLLASIAPALWLGRRRGPQPAKTCLACGYDLRGVPSGPCPECGAGSALETKSPGQFSMRRRFLNVVAMISIVLFSWMLTLWVCNQWMRFSFHRTADAMDAGPQWFVTVIHLEALNHGVWLGYSDTRPLFESEGRPPTPSVSWETNILGRNVLGVQSGIKLEWRTHDEVNAGAYERFRRHGFTLVLPYYILLALAGVLPMVAAVPNAREALSKRRRRREVGNGYDLRGTPSGGGAAPGTPAPANDSGGGSGTPTKTCPECGAASASPASPATPGKA
jgi:hypothetical protein